MKEWESTMWKDGIAGYVVPITDLFLEERYRVIITDGAFRTQIRGDIVCQGTVDTKSKFVRVSLKKYSVHNLGVTLCVNTTQG